MVYKKVYYTSRTSKILIIVLLLALLILGINYFIFKPSNSQPPTENNNSQPPTEKFCGWSTNGNCIHDSDCIVSGCSNQLCQSRDEGSIVTTCEWRDCYDAKKYGLNCKCVEGKCQWSK